MSQTRIRQALALWNDGLAVRQAVRRRSGRPIAMRLARRAYGKATGRLAARLFRPR